VDDYHRVIEIAGDIPVLVRGGGKATNEEVIERTTRLMEQGASGIVYGRNIIQHEDPALMTKVLMGIVHEGKSVDESLNVLAG
jgi:DhnA family fructose-bisphosphate aldolase class Ia